MARNRRQSESMTFAIGRGCFLLLAGVTCVGFSVIKIIVGSEYVSKCPSREMIPVYIIISGCLPVLLSALRQPYDSGHETEKDKWSMKVSLIIAIIGVMVNLAWLVAGTYLVVTVWNGNICSTATVITSETSSMSPNVTNKTLFIHSENNWITSNSSQYQYKADDKKINKIVNETGKMPVNISNNVVNTVTSKPSDKRIETSEDVDKVNEVTSVKPQTQIIGNKTFSSINDGSKDMSEVRDASRENATEIRLNTTEVTDIDLNKEMDIGKEDTDSSNTTSQDKQCVTCDIHILRFSLAVIIIDWLFVVIGIVYFCNFVINRFSSITSKLLLINA